jgi:hypothetical protein
LIYIILTPDQEKNTNAPKKETKEEAKKDDDDNVQIIEKQLQELDINQEESNPWEKLKFLELNFHVDELIIGLKNHKYKNIVFMTGAGISVSAGIPDFRSPGIGLYARLAKLNLPKTELIFDLDYFKKNPKPFYEASKELFGYKAKPVTSHYFQRIIQEKGLLRWIFTQNIDSLELDAGWVCYLS